MAEYLNIEGGAFKRGPPSGQKRPNIWAGMLAEFFGSLLFVLVAAGAGAIQPSLSHPDSVLFALANGFGLMAAIWISASIPGSGQINPVVTITLWIYSFFEPEPKRFWWFTTGWGTLYYPLLWIFAQFVGAIVAALLLLAIFGGGSDLGRPLVGPGFEWGRAFGFEIIGTTIILGVHLYFIWGYGRISHEKWEKKGLKLTAIPVGLTHLVLSAIGAFISSASFNWWRHFGPTVISNTWNADGDPSRNVDWIWYVGPIGGAAVALGSFWLVLFLYKRIVEPRVDLSTNSNNNQKIYVRKQMNRKSKSKSKSKSQEYVDDSDDEVDEHADNLF